MTDTPHTIGFIGKRYELLSRVGHGGMGIVYLATDRLTGQNVALKQVMISAQKLHFATKANTIDIQLALAQEFQTLSSLRHPNIITVLDYGFNNEVKEGSKLPFFTMDYLENANRITDYAKDTPLETQMGLIVQLLRALTYLHRRNLLHRDLKPANVLVVDGHVKVLDFGLAIINDNAQDRDDAVGTLAYMAPELLQGSQAHVASDLYAVGIMAYELLAGKHPHNIDNVVDLIHGIVHTDPDLTVLNVPQNILNVVERLLKKNPEERYRNPQEVIADIQNAITLPDAGGSVEIRESFLQAAQFVGREQEFSQLTGVLNRVIETGMGSAWLIGGESGVGKSRIADELRTLALVRGVQVLRGQDVSDSHQPYWAWRTVLRRLMLLVTIEDEEASIVKPLIPDIDKLLNREVVASEPLDDPQSTQERLVNTIEGIFRRAIIREKQQLMILIEDIHWAESATISLLGRLASNLTDGAVLIVATYRDDERPNLPASLPQFELLTLERLTERDIVALSESMLGEAGRRESVVSLLKRETEGNVFFMVEVVRALAEDAGDIDDIGRMTLPTSLFSKGIAQIIQRRLNSVPEFARELLKISAVIGRQIDLTLLRAIAPQADLDDWLTQCVASAVISAEDSGIGRWRFAHDKLREGLLENLTETERQNFHQTVAEAIERIYDVDEYASQLAYLWQVVGNKEKELLFSTKAAEQGILNTANIEAIAYFQRALTILGELPSNNSDKRIRMELDIQMALGSAIMAVKGYAAKEAEQAYLRARELCQKIEDPAKEAQVLRGMAAYYIGLGRYRQVYDMAQELYLIASKNNLFIDMIGSQIYRGLSLGFIGEYEQCAQVLRRIVEAYDPHQHGSSTGSLQDYGVTSMEVLAVATWVLGYPDQASELGEQALQVADILQHPISQAFALHWTGIIHYFRGEYLTCLQLAEATIRLAREKNFDLFVALGMAYDGLCKAKLNPGSPEALQTLRSALQACRNAKTETGITLFMAGIAEILADSGQGEEAIKSLDEAFALMEEKTERWLEPELIRLRGELQWKVQKDQKQAEESFRQSITLAQSRKGRSWALRSAISLYRLLEAQKHHQDAQDQLHAIYQTFDEGTDTYDLRIARELLEGAGLAI